MQALCAWLYKDTAIKKKTDDLNQEPVTMLGLFLLNEQLCSTIRVGGQRALNIAAYKFEKYLLSQNRQLYIFLVHIESLIIIILSWTSSQLRQLIVTDF